MHMTFLGNTIIILKLHLSVRVSVRDGTLQTFTGNRVDPETFSLSHSGLEAISGLLWKATCSLVLLAGMTASYVSAWRESKS